MELFGIGPWVAVGALAFAVILILTAAVYVVHSAPPTSITLSAGPEGSMYFKNAQKYAAILKKSGITLNIRTSQGSGENLERLKDPKSNIDIGIVQTGISDSGTDSLISLGSVSYQPLLIFYRGKKIELLSDLKGKKVAIGPMGSGTRTVALALLAANGISENDPTTTLLSEDALTAAEGMKSKRIDAAFIMSESASTEVMRALLHEDHDDIELLSLKQATAYSRKFEYLHVLEFPQGVIDFGKNIPNHDITLVGPMVEIIAKKNFHPGLIDLFIDAATEVHSRPGVFQKRGDFPAALEHSIHLSEDAAIYYKSGKTYLYRVFPFWLASLLSRLFVVLVPLLILLVPTLRAVPAFFKWTTQLRIRRRYRELRLLEQRYLHETSDDRKKLLRTELARIAHAVNRMKVNASFADQFYALRGHIDYVRRVVELGPEQV